MAGGPHTQLANLRNVQDPTLSNVLLDNFIYFYDWGFLDRGSFYNITIPQSDIYGGDRHKLRSATDPIIAMGKFGKHTGKTGFGRVAYRPPQNNQFKYLAFLLMMFFTLPVIQQSPFISTTQMVRLFLILPKVQQAM